MQHVDAIQRALLVDMPLSCIMKDLTDKNMVLDGDDVKRYRKRWWEACLRVIFVKMQVRQALLIRTK